MKKYISIIMTVILLAASLCGCGSGKGQGKSGSGQTSMDPGKIQIVTTIFPAYDWVTNVLGDRKSEADVTMLLDNGVDIHSYQPTAEDILKIATCDLFVYVGGESDAWVEDALQEAANKDMVVINLMETLGTSIKEEEMVEGMQEEEHEHDHEEDEGQEEDEHEHEEAEEHEEDGHDHEEGEIEYDEHVWLSLNNSRVLVEAIAEALESIDPDHSDSYKENAAAYTEKLTALDKDYQETVSAAAVKTLVFGDRFPFRYLVDDYGLSYYAAFVGCSAETEASFETITFLAGKIDELSLHNVMTIEGSDHRIAQAIIENTKTKDQKILTLDSMQSTTSKDLADGVTYLSIMEGNLAVLKESLQ